MFLNQNEIMRGTLRHTVWLMQYKMRKLDREPSWAKPERALLAQGLCLFSHMRREQPKIYFLSEQADCILL
jgi:hypothetical protein